MAAAREITSLKKNMTEESQIAEGRQQTIATLEGAVQSLKEVIQQNSLKINTLVEEIKQYRSIIGEKDRAVQIQTQKLAAVEKDITDLQIVLGDAGQTIDLKNEAIETHLEKIETLKADKQNLLNIVQQLATIGNPVFGLNSLVGSVTKDDSLPAATAVNAAAVSSGYQNIS